MRHYHFLGTLSKDKEKTYDEKLYYFFEYLSNINFRSFREHQEILESLILFFKKKEKKQFLLLVDNIDALLSMVKMEIILTLFDLSERCGLKLLLPVRPSTFLMIQEYSNFQYEFIKMVRIKPIDVIRKRAKYYLNNNHEFRFLPEQHQRILKSRLTWLTKQDELTKFGRYLDAKSGNNIRFALRLVEKVFVNGIIPYDKDATEDLLPYTIMLE